MVKLPLFQCFHKNRMINQVIQQSQALRKSLTVSRAQKLRAFKASISNFHNEESRRMQKRMVKIQQHLEAQYQLALLLDESTQFLKGKPTLAQEEILRATALFTEAAVKVSE